MTSTDMHDDIIQQPAYSGTSSSSGSAALVYNLTQFQELTEPASLNNEQSSIPIPDTGHTK